MSGAGDDPPDPGEEEPHRQEEAEADTLWSRLDREFLIILAVNVLIWGAVAAVVAWLF